MKQFDSYGKQPGDGLLSSKTGNGGTASLTLSDGSKISNLSYRELDEMIDTISVLLA